MAKTKRRFEIGDIVFCPCGTTPEPYKVTGWKKKETGISYQVESPHGRTCYWDERMTFSWNEWHKSRLVWLESQIEEARAMKEPKFKREE